jgi:allantoin racemase
MLELSCTGGRLLGVTAMSKVLVLVPFPLDAGGVERRRSQLSEVAINPDITFEFRSVRLGPRYFDSYHDSMIADLAITEAGMGAVEQGFDAVCVDTVSDSGVNVLRSLIDIPVVGAGRVSFLAALALGERFSILTTWQPWAFGYERTLREAGLESRCASIRWTTGTTPDVDNLLAGKEADVFPKLLEAAEQCMADGADVICLGSTTMHEAHRFLSEHVRVPVINPGPLSYKVVEALLALGLHHSPSAYPRPRGPQPRLISSMVDAGVGVRER